MKKIIVITLVALLAGWVYLDAKTPKSTKYEPQQSSVSTQKQNASGSSKTKSQKNASNTKSSFTYSAPIVPEAVDLGLSVKWASMNLGAKTPGGYGWYIAWGEMAPKATYYDKNSTWDNVSYDELLQKGVVDSSGNLTPPYDVATVNLGAPWRMPTKAEAKELLSKCEWEWCIEEGHKGYKITGPNGSSIFLPAAGDRGDKSVYNVGTDGDYRTSTIEGKWANEFMITFNKKEYRIGVFSEQASWGNSIRPVCK